MIGLIDYGAGNMQSVANALAHLALPFKVCLTPGQLDGVDRILLPGVGHFGPAARRMKEVGLADALMMRAENGTPLLGICLGMQLLFGNSNEAPDVAGLGLLPGQIVELQASRVPHMGWNEVAFTRFSPLSDEGKEAYFYFAHSYVAADVCSEHVLGSTGIDDQRVPAMIGRDKVWGVQFHPEKSGTVGLAMLQRFAQC